MPNFLKWVISYFHGWNALKADNRPVPDYTTGAIKPPNQAPEASEALSKMCVAWRCQFWPLVDGHLQLWSELSICPEGSNFKWIFLFQFRNSWPSLRTWGIFVGWSHTLRSFAFCKMFPTDPILVLISSPIIYNINCWQSGINELNRLQYHTVKLHYMLWLLFDSLLLESIFFVIAWLF